ncbi:MAG: rRNA pseudouridine synthase [Prevotellaceae bacterium]|jgi:23S rRNA pseudouridine2605 synthase|nr:rRNA pseudouridine synthase [Prevotellaceae bacterium]
MNNTYSRNNNRRPPRSSNNAGRNDDRPPRKFRPATDKPVFKLRRKSTDSTAENEDRRLNKFGNSNTKRGGYSERSYDDRPPRKFRPATDKPVFKLRRKSTDSTAEKEDRRLNKFGNSNTKRGGYSERSYDNRPPRKFRPPTDKRAGFKPKTAVRKPTKPVQEKEDVRLNKFIANSGICSRREADEYITAGLVSVNGNVVTELGVKVKRTDDIRFNNERIKGEQKVYIVMNKPKDYVTTTSDPHAENTVIDLIGSKCPQRVFPVGRLDRNTTGVLLLTNDGDLAEQLTHPSYEKKKIYHIFLDRNIPQTDLQKLVDGFTLDDGHASADLASYVDNDRAQVGLEIHSGRNRIVRRMFEHLGYKVKKLDRVYFAGLTKKNLKRGQWRFLTTQEITMLRMGAYE